MFHRSILFIELPEITTCNDSVDLSPNNPFMETQHRETPLDIALQTLQVSFFNVCKKVTKLYYNIYIHIYIRRNLSRI